MGASFLKTAWRNFRRHSYYSLLNVLGLALGLCCAIILFLFITYQLRFDRYHTHARHLYRIVTDLHLPDGSVEYEHGSPLVLSQLIKQQLPAVENTAALLGGRTFTVAIDQGDQAAEKLFYEFENAGFTDNNWFNLFSYHWKYGNRNTALSAPYTAVITSGLARKYFNAENVIGKKIRLDNKYDVVITGVLADNPANTDTRTSLFLSMSSIHTMYPGEDTKMLLNDIGFIYSKNQVYLLLRDGATPGQVNQRIQDITQSLLVAYGGAYHFHLQSLRDVHFDSRYGGTMSRQLLWVLTMIALALIAVACVNFVNMANAQSLRRVKEIGTRKVLGGSRMSVFWQFIGETAIVTVFSGMLAVLGTWAALPVVSNWLQLPLAFDGMLWVFLPLLLLLMVFAAGFYPAVVLSRFKPVHALKDQPYPGGNAGFSRKLLIVVQNAVAQLLIICTLVISLQVKFMKTVDLGFNKDAVLMVPIPDRKPATLSFLHNQLVAAPGVRYVSFCFRPPAAATNKGGEIRYDNKPWEKFAVRSIAGDEHYLQTFGLQLLAGRNLSPTDSSAYLVNEQLLTRLGIQRPEQAIGHALIAGDFSDKNGTIVGVVKDFHNHSLHNRIEPAIIAPQASLYEYVAVKIAGVQQGNAIAHVKQIWEKTFPHAVFEYHFLDEQIAAFYAREAFISRLVSTSALVAIFISCLGMLGLISLITVQRTKEIGIRKVLGATVSSIVQLFVRDFAQLVLIAVVISTPLAWWAMHQWLQHFAYRIGISWWIPGLSALLILLIACITISLQAVKAAVLNPVKALRRN